MKYIFFKSQIDFLTKFCFLVLGFNTSIYSCELKENLEIRKNISYSEQEAQSKDSILLENSTSSMPMVKRWKDTFFIEELGIEVQSSYQYGIACDPYLYETFIVKDENGKIKEQYEYRVSNGIPAKFDSFNPDKPIIDQEASNFHYQSWNKDKISPQDLTALIKRHLLAAKKK